MGKEAGMTGNKGRFYRNDIVVSQLPQEGLRNLPVGKKNSIGRKPGRHPPVRSGNCTLISSVITGVSHGGT
jgi:hypothetical protein